MNSEACNPAVFASGVPLTRRSSTLSPQTPLCIRLSSFHSFHLLVPLQRRLPPPSAAAELPRPRPARFDSPLLSPAYRLYLRTRSLRRLAFAPDRSFGTAALPFA